MVMADGSEKEGLFEYAKNIPEIHTATSTPASPEKPSRRMGEFKVV
jgi:hypothetical protein